MVRRIPWRFLVTYVIVRSGVTIAFSLHSSARSRDRVSPADSDQSRTLQESAKWFLDTGTTRTPTKKKIITGEATTQELIVNLGYGPGFTSGQAERFRDLVLSTHRHQGPRKFDVLLTLDVGSGTTGEQELCDFVLPPTLTKVGFRLRTGSVPTSHAPTSACDAYRELSLVDQYDNTGAPIGLFLFSEATLTRDFPTFGAVRRLIDQDLTRPDPPQNFGKNTRLSLKKNTIFGKYLDRNRTIRISTISEERHGAAAKDLIPGARRFFHDKFTTHKMGLGWSQHLEPAAASILAYVKNHSGGLSGKVVPDRYWITCSDVAWAGRDWVDEFFDHEELERENEDLLVFGADTNEKVSEKHFALPLYPWAKGRSQKSLAKEGAGYVEGNRGQKRFFLWGAALATSSFWRNILREDKVYDHLYREGEVMVRLSKKYVGVLLGEVLGRGSSVMSEVGWPTICMAYGAETPYDLRCGWRGDFAAKGRLAALGVGTPAEIRRQFDAARAKAQKSPMRLRRGIWHPVKEF